MVLLLNFDVDEVAILSQFADERIDLAKRELWTTFQVSADKTVFIDAQFESGRARILDRGNAELFGQGKNAEDPADAWLSMLPVEGFTECPDVGAGASGTS
jgi:hypothetical protein